MISHKCDDIFYYYCFLYIYTCTECNSRRLKFECPRMVQNSCFFFTCSRSVIMFLANHISSTFLYLLIYKIEFLFSHTNLQASINSMNHIYVRRHRENHSSKTRHSNRQIQNKNRNVYLIQSD